MNNANKVIPFGKPTVNDECQTCAWRNDCLLGQTMPGENGACADVIQRQLHITSGKVLFRRSEPFRSVYVVCAGAVKTQRVTPGGDLVVTGFCLPGDIVGFEALGSEQHEFDAVTTAPSSIVRLDIAGLLAFCAHRPAVHTWFMRRIGHLLRRKDVDQAWSKGLQTSERILRFFLDLHERMRSQDAGVSIEGELPMRKQDIARYLNITPETLSRNLMTLRQKRLLLIRHNHYALPDAEQARRLTRL